MKAKEYIVYIGFLLFIQPVHSNILGYKDIDSKLREVWNEMYPVPFTKIIKKDLAGKGILVYKRDAKNLEYIYTFMVFMPRYKLENEIPVPETEGREVFVKLIYNPKKKENQYSINLGEFSEIYNPRSIVKWMK